MGDAAGDAGGGGMGGGMGEVMVVGMGWCGGSGAIKGIGSVLL